MRSLSTNLVCFLGKLLICLACVTLIGCGDDSVGELEAQLPGEGRYEPEPEIDTDPKPETEVPVHDTVSVPAEVRDTADGGPPMNREGETLDGELDAVPLVTAVDSDLAIAEEVAWIEDFETAKETARRDGRDILMDFTGSDWCGWCIRLDNEVFRYAQFSDYADENFVLLKLDYPRDRSLISEETMTQNAELQSRFAIQGYPTILLADSEGRPYAQTGYQRGGPEFYVQHLEELKQIRVERDRVFAASDNMQGAERAQKLHQALELIEPHLVLPSYDSVVAEIVSLDADNEAGLKETLGERLAASRFQQAMLDLERQLQETGDIDAALQKLDELEGQFVEFEQGQLPLRLARLELFQLAKRTEEVIALADSILSEDIRSRQALFSAHAAKLNAFASTERLDDALTVVADMQEEFSDQPRLLLQLLLRRADFLKQLGREDEARASIVDARESAGPQAAAAIDQFERELLGDVPTPDENETPIE